ncbi:MAG: DUF4394 domain-containing protein [Chthoniobacterales bacterium]
MKLRSHLTILATAGLALALSKSADARPYGYAYNATGQLYQFDLTNPSSVVPVGPATAGANTKGIDVRPGTSTIYAVDITATTTQIFTVSPTTGVRTPVGPAIPNTGTADNADAYAINPNAAGYGFNFNPVTLQNDGSSRFRLVDSDGNNFRFNSSTGTVAIVDGSLNYTDGTTASDEFAAASYTNSDEERMGTAVAGTALYYLDADNDILAISPSPNDGTLTNAGSLDIDIDVVAGMEIYSPVGNVTAGGGSNFAYIVVSEDNGATFQLRTIPNIGASASPASAPFGTFPAGFEPVNGFAILEAEELTPPTTATGYAYNADGQLFSFPLGAPGSVTPIGAASAGATVKGLDFRPGTFSLYSIAVGPTTSQISLVNIGTGAVTTVGAPFNNVGLSPEMPPEAYSFANTSNFGFDFNPTTLQQDGSIRVRLVDDQGLNLRFNTNTGALTNVDGTIPVGITAAGYTNSDTARMGAATTPTRLFYLDPANDQLFTSPAANAGTSEVVGPFNSDADSNTGFDILSFSGFNVGYATVDLGGTGLYSLVTVDLQTGRFSTPIGVFPAGFTPERGFSVAVLPDPAPPAVVVPDTTRPRVVTKKISRNKDVGRKRSRFLLRGKAIDDTGVTQVLVREKGSRFRPANGTRNWRFRLDLRPGRNPVRIVAFDSAGNRSKVKRIVITRGK